MSRPRSEHAREKMLGAATQLIFTSGLCHFTVDEVAKLSGVAKTTVYRHFPNKNQLLIAALDAGIAVPVTPDTGTLRTDLLEFLASVVPIFADERLRMLLLDIMSAAMRDPELEEFCSSMMDGRMVPLATIIDRGRARGEISADMDFDQAFLHIEGPLIFWSLFKPDVLKTLDLEVTVDRMLKVLKT